ncbi:MAG: RNA 2',3'-cyclic phosphodiesterase [Verrucomicrobia bacterium]|nr:RNA 2',3'-cyclic phosphodiesterase [Verrucomicrobiota bacterium]
MGETKRTFVAVEPTAAVRARFDEAQRLLRRAGADVRWVKSSHAHLTLKFLGESTSRQIGEISAALDKIAAGTEPFEVAFGGLGVFPDQRRPRVLWVGITSGVEQLKPLAAAIDARAVQAGFESERRTFSPHITLGRFRSPQGWPELSKLLAANASFDAGRMRAAEVSLIHSILSPQGPTYSALHVARFSAKG